MLAFAAPAALMLPLLGLSAGASLPDSELPVRSQEPKIAVPQSTSDRTTSVTYAPLDAWYRSQIVRQVRIQQRVIIRISPARRAPRQSMLAELTQRQQVQRFEEKRIGKCLAVEGVSAVQTDRGNRLLLFLKDRRIVSLNLEKACRARDFYSGFYVERSEDGQICVDRDKLHSRNGAICEIERMRQLVAVTE